MLAPACEWGGWRYSTPLARLQLWGCEFDPHDLHHCRQLISESAILRILIEAVPHVEVLGISKNGAGCSREIAMDKISIVENDHSAFIFSEGAPSRDLICRVVGILLRVIFCRHAVAVFNFLEVCRMNAIRAVAVTVFLSLVCVSNLSGQDNSAANPAVNPAQAPPYLLVLVHQEILYGKATARQRLEVATTRICNRIDAPSSWIDLQSMTGPRQVLFFDPFDSFEQIEQSSAAWAQVYVAHPDLARMQEEIDALLKTENTTIAVRRDDLGYLVDHIDLSKLRFMRVVEVRLLPGHEDDFVEASMIVGEAYQKIGEETPWVVYQVKSGMESPVFFVFMPMPALRQNDDLLTWENDLRKAEGEEDAKRLDQIARAGYVSTKSTLYAVSAAMSHVSKELAAGDPGFWRPKQVIASKTSGVKANAALGEDPVTTKSSALKISETTQNQ